jgi:acyl-CoA synthetase (AMP-forming)/AMP-acid ligase II
MDSCLTLVDLLQKRARCQPHQVAYRFLKGGEVDQACLTYGELGRKARAIAVYLQSLNLSGSRVVLIYPYEAGLEFISAFWGCLSAGVVAVPCHPPLNRHAYNELQARLSSSQAGAVMTHKSLIDKLKTQLNPSDNFQHWIISENIPDTNSGDWSEPNIKPDSLAFLQYTSGSTGTPKGVMITHESILYNQQMLKLAFEHTDRAVGVGWLPLFHDMGLIGNVIQALYVGSPSILMSPIAFIQKPIRWLQAISRFQATTSGAPNFAYDLLCRHVTHEQRKTLDLSSWNVAFSGAEPIRVETIERFSHLFSPCGFRREAFYSCYGMAEAVLLITGGQKAKPPVIQYVSEAALGENRVLIAKEEKGGFRSMVGCGQTWLKGRIVIVDPTSLTRCPLAKVGEIWVSDSGLGKGYWNDRQCTEATFQAYLQDTGEGPFLRTGDLGFLHDGELFVTGRLRDVMIFWGINHYPQLLEKTIESCHPALRCNGTAAFSVEIAGEDRLIVAQEVERHYRQSLNINEVAEVIRWTLFDQHFVDVYAIVFLKPGGIPKTSSGKIQHHACRAKFLEGSLDAIGQWQCPPHQLTDVTSVIRRYFNPLIHLRRHRMMIQSRLKRIFSSYKV